MPSIMGVSIFIIMTSMIKGMIAVIISVMLLMVSAC